MPEENTATAAVARGESLETFLTRLPLSKWPAAEKEYKAAQHAAHVALVGNEARGGCIINTAPFSEADCGGVFDGFGVVSDADPGL